MTAPQQQVNSGPARGPWRENYIKNSPKVFPNPKAKLLDQVREVLRVKHYAIRTEEMYIHWIKRYILFHKKRHPNEIGDDEIRAFLIHLAEKEDVAASTHTAPAVGAGGIRHLVRFFFSTAMCSIRT